MEPHVQLEEVEHPPWAARRLPPRQAARPAEIEVAVHLTARRLSWVPEQAKET